MMHLTHRVCYESQAAVQHAQPVSVAADDKRTDDQQLELGCQQFQGRGFMSE